MIRKIHSVLDNYAECGELDHQQEFFFICIVYEPRHVISNNVVF